MSPSLENFVILTWLRLIHPDLPKLVKQRYGTDLRSRTLASIKPEISQALDSLLDEVNMSESAKIMRTSSTNPFKSRHQHHGRDLRKPSTGSSRSRNARQCPLCQQAGRQNYNHFLSECSFLPDNDRKFIAKARQIAGILDKDIERVYESELPTPDEYLAPESTTSALRVQVRQSPYLDTFFAHHRVRLIIDSGATGNMIRLSTVKKLGLELRESAQSAHQADGSSPLVVVGETSFSLVRDQYEFTFEGLVVENLDVEVLAGTPFMIRNDIAIRPSKRLVMLGDNKTYHYGSTDSNSEKHSVRFVILRAPETTTTIWPGEFVELEIPENNTTDCEYALEPHGVVSNENSLWPPPQITASVGGKVRIPNLTKEPLRLNRNEHVCQIRPVYVPERTDEIAISKPLSVTSQKHSQNVLLNPDKLLSPEITAEFASLLDEYDDVFNTNFKGYNGASGPFQAKVNMGPVLPPQRKGRLPQYARDKLVELQEKFDELENKGVFMRPEDAAVSVEYLNPSFLVKKANGGHRLVTAFSDVGRYSKPQPSLMPDVDSTMRRIAQWKYIITTDLTSAFYQIPLSKESMKFCGVATPFRGVRVYVRSAMGMPGSETALEELM